MIIDGKSSQYGIWQTLTTVRKWYGYRSIGNHFSNEQSIYSLTSHPFKYFMSDIIFNQRIEKNRIELYCHDEKYSTIKTSTWYRFTMANVAGYWQLSALILTLWALIMINENKPYPWFDTTTDIIWYDSLPNGPFGPVSGHDLYHHTICMTQISDFHLACNYNIVCNLTKKWWSIGFAWCFKKTARKKMDIQERPSAWYDGRIFLGVIQYGFENNPVVYMMAGENKWWTQKTKCRSIPLQLFTEGDWYLKLIRMSISVWGWTCWTHVMVTIRQ